MAISLKTTKQIWGAAASRCSFPTCRRKLIVEATQSDDESLVGDLCHIVARSPEGPRGQSTLTLEERDRAENLILLCKIHHKCIDDQSVHYTVARVLDIKSTHEYWVNNTLSSAGGVYSPFVLFELSYNAFWIEAHAGYAARNPDMQNSLYGNYIYQRVNRCKKSLASLRSDLPNIHSAIDDIYTEFEHNIKNYAHIQAFAYSLGMQIRNTFLSDADKKVISISRSLVSLLKGKALGEDVDSSAFGYSVKCYLEKEDPVINRILLSDTNDEFETRLITRLEDLL